MTADEWKDVEQRLYMREMVDLLVDGYKISLVTVQDKTKLYIQPFVNGKIKGKWLIEDCEERRRFMCKCRRCLIKSQDKKKLKLTKKEYEQLRQEYTSYYYTPYFGSFRTLKSQLINNNKSIEII